MRVFFTLLSVLALAVSEVDSEKVSYEKSVLGNRGEYRIEHHKSSDDKYPSLIVAISQKKCFVVSTTDQLEESLKISVKVDDVADGVYEEIKSGENSAELDDEDVKDFDDQYLDQECSGREIYSLEFDQ